MIDILLAVIFIAGVALFWNEGLWSLCLMLINVTIAGIVALNFYEPLADFMESKSLLGGSFTYLVDFLSIWTIFGLTAVIMRSITDTMCRVRVRFQMHVEQVGRVVLGMWLAWSMVGFCALTLHMAPLPVNGFGGSFDKPPALGLLFGLAPDRAWLAYMQTISQGACGWEDETAVSRYDKVDGKIRVFDPHSEFLVKYRTRRMKLEEAVNNSDGKILVNRAGDPPAAP